MCIRDRADTGCADTDYRPECGRADTGHAAAADRPECSRAGTVNTQHIIIRNRKTHEKR